MKKIFIVLSLCFPLAINVAKAQKTTAAAKDSATFMKNFTALFNLTNTATTEAEGPVSGLMVDKPEYGAYALKAGKGLPGAEDEAMTFYEAGKKWGYYAKFGKFVAGQEAAQQAKEEKLTKLVMAGIENSGWQAVKPRPNSDPSMRMLVHYNNIKTGRYIMLWVSKRASGNVIILSWK